MLVEGLVGGLDGESSNGRTAVSDTVNPGSSPGSPAKKIYKQIIFKGFLDLLKIKILF